MGKSVSEWHNLILAQQSRFQIAYLMMVLFLDNLMHCPVNFRCSYEKQCPFFKIIILMCVFCGMQVNVQ